MIDDAYICSFLNELIIPPQSRLQLQIIPIIQSTVAVRQTPLKQPHVIVAVPHYVLPLPFQLPILEVAIVNLTILLQPPTPIKLLLPELPLVNQVLFELYVFALHLLPFYYLACEDSILGRQLAISFHHVIFKLPLVVVGFAVVEALAFSLVVLELADVIIQLSSYQHALALDLATH